MDWSGLWCFYQLFGLSFWRHPFTAEEPLVSKWWNATFLQIYSIKKQTSLNLGWYGVHFKQIQMSFNRIVQKKKYLLKKKKKKKRYFNATCVNKQSVIQGWTIWQNYSFNKAHINKALKKEQSKTLTLISYTLREFIEIHILLVNLHGSKLWGQ